MRRAIFRLLILGFLLAACASLHADEQPAPDKSDTIAVPVHLDKPPEPVKDPPEKVRLRYQFKVGDKTRYNLSMLGNGSIQFLGQKESVPLKTKTGIGCTQKVTAFKDGWYTVEWITRGANVDITDYGPISVTIPDLDLQIDERGRVGKLDGTRELSISPAVGQDKVFAGLLGQLRSSGFPEKELAKGDTWKESYRVKLLGAKPQEVAVESKLEGFDVVDSFDCARIKSSYDTPVLIEIEDDTFGTVRVEGKERGEITTWFAYKEGKLTRAEGEINLKLAMSTTKGGEADGKLKGMIDVKYEGATARVKTPDWAAEEE